MRALPAPALVVHREVNDEARSGRYRKRGFFGWDRRGGHRECTVLSPLRPCSNLYLACLYPPNPRLGSSRGRSAHDSVCRPEQSGSHRRWEAWLQSSPPPLGGRRGVDHKQSLANVRFSPAPASAHEGGGSVLSLRTTPRGRAAGTGGVGLQEGGRLPLPGEVVADVGVAVRGIEPQAPVKWKRLIQLIDLRAGVGDGRWNVNAGRWLGQRQRWWA